MSLTTLLSLGSNPSLAAGVLTSFLQLSNSLHPFRLQARPVTPITSNHFASLHTASHHFTHFTSHHTRSLRSHLLAPPFACRSSFALPNAVDSLYFPLPFARLGSSPFVLPPFVLPAPFSLFREGVCLFVLPLLLRLSYSSSVTFHHCV